MVIRSTWRIGALIYFRTSANGGFNINYSYIPRRVSRWIERRDTMTITMLPVGIHLFYRQVRDRTNWDHIAEYFKEFTDDEVGNMDLEALYYMYAVEEFADRREDLEDNDED
ncbi:MAG: hypothetical protein ACKPKO_59710 [Candidatus Fonsibacter sp.]